MKSMADRRRERDYETYWPLCMVKRSIRLARAKELDGVVRMFDSADAERANGWVKERARKRARKLRETDYV